MQATLTPATAGDGTDLGREAPLLSVRNLTVRFRTPGGVLTAVDGVDLDVRRGEVLGIVGESGSGKSMTMLAVTKLVPPANGTVTADAILFDGVDLATLSGARLRHLRGSRIGFIFQNPLSSLNPLLTIGEQIGETVRVHMGLSRQAARARAIALIDRVGIPNARGRVDDYPHQFSGGMRQRAMIAMAIACDPVLILADEPTTALDVTIQAQIIDLLRGIVQDMGAAIVLVTHDLGIAASICHRINVMYAGQIVETGSVDRIFSAPLMPYTWGLLDSIPRFDRAAGSELPIIPGLPPDPLSLGAGCRFAPRCGYRRERCADGPRLESREGSARDGSVHLARCFGTAPDGWLEVAP